MPMGSPNPRQCSGFGIGMSVHMNGIDIIMIMMSMIKSTHGFTLMDKQLLLAAMSLGRCCFKPHIQNTVLCWQHSQTCPGCPGGSVGRQG